MGIFSFLAPWWRRKAVRGALVLGIIVGASVVFLRGGDVDLDANSAPAAFVPSVTLISAAEYAGNQSLSLIGTARAVREATITAERGGRVVAVPVVLGQNVQAGQVIAQLENAAERAALTQAEGAYEAALAAASQNDVGVDEAETAIRTAQEAAVTAYRNAYTTAVSVVRNNIDDFFAQPNSPAPGLRIDGRGQTNFLSSERIAFQSLLSDWQVNADTLRSDADLQQALQEGEANTSRILAVVDVFIELFNSQSNRDRYSEAELRGFSTAFTTIRANLVSSINSLQSANSAISNAESALARAQLAASGSNSSAADAQIKQALGSLEAARANVAETVLRSPISGTVNQLDVRVGDFISSFSAVAVVANNAALEIITSVSETERTLIAVGDEVTIDGRVAGQITAIAPAVNSTTGKIEVRIVASDSALTNGDTVRITKVVDSAAVTENPEFVVPLTAIKFTVDAGTLFTVDTNSQLVAVPIEVASVLGNTATLVGSPLAVDELFVEDARGLTEGSEVMVKQ
jgi:multidrug efflux pump subunit AcrA (membrane-fusion protein)